MGARPRGWMACPLEAAAALRAPELHAVAAAAAHLSWSSVGASIDPDLAHGEIVQRAVLRFCLAFGHPYPRRVR